MANSFVPHDMTRPEEYQLLILGSGEGGKYLAWTMAKKGLRVALVEREYIRYGSCARRRW